MRVRILVLLLAIALPGFSQDAPKTLAVINGEQITEDQVRTAASRNLENIEARRLQAEAEYERNKYGALETALNDIVAEKLIAAESAKRGVSKEELLTTEIDRKVDTPSEEVLKSFYDENRSRINGSFEEVKDQIRNYLMDQKKEEFYSSFISRLRTDYKVETFMEPRRLKVETAGHPAQGPADAPVTIVEFSDFECPFCGNFYPTMKLVERNYAGKIRFIYRQFPLTSIHPNAQKAAEASLCAFDQQRFWELHDEMFQDQRNLTVDDLKQKASKIQLDQNAFNSCLDSGKHAEAVRKDIAEGARLGVTGTPSTFINGRYLDGARPYADLAKIIDEELRAAEGAK